MSALFTPLKLGSTTIPNRIGMSALTRSRSTNTVPNDIMLKHYLQRAEGGAGLIVTEGVLVTRQGTEWPFAPGLWNQEQVEEWKKIVDAVHGAGTKIYAQLWHLGRTAHPDAPEQIAAGVPVYAPSAVSARGGKFRHIPGEPGYVTPTEIADPQTLIDLFKQAAINAKAAGFDGVELHGANGYLVQQFLDSNSNKRTDAWGGSPEKRARFALETLKVLQEVFGVDVAIKLNPTGGYNDMGMPLDETIATYGYLLSQIDALPTPLSYVTLARYNAFLDPEYDGKLRATKHDVLATFGGDKFLKSGRTHIFVNSGLTPEEAEELVKTGQAAGVFFGMAFVTHPDVGKRIKAGKALDNAPDWAHLYGAPGVDPALGYTDYPAASA